MKGWWTGLLGQPHHQGIKGPYGPKGPIKGGPAKTLTLGAGLGAKAPQPPALGRPWGAPPCHLYKEGKGRGAAHLWEPLWQTLAAPSMLLHLSCATPLPEGCRHLLHPGLPYHP